MRTKRFASLVAVCCAIVVPARGVIVNFSYTQSDQVTGAA